MGEGGGGVKGGREKYQSQAFPHLHTAREVEVDQFPAPLAECDGLDSFGGELCAVG